jgi:predicted TIM-barrel fold metal-dependent hydrolase
MDLHVHLFGIGDSGSGCRLSKKITEGALFKWMSSRFLRWAKTLDEGYVMALNEQLQGSGLAKGLILAQDAVYDRHGKPDWDKTHFYVPNDYLLRVVRNHPQSMVPCVSINPDRADAIAELDRSADEGAKALKIHPPTQGVDLADKKRIPFFRRCAQRKVVVLVHTGHEHSAPVVDIGLAHPRKLTLALEEGCTVVACHCGTGWPIHDRPDMLPDFLAMLRQYPNLWGDTAVLGTAMRVHDVTRLLADRGAADRLLHGSDFPFPSAPLAFAQRIGLTSAVRFQAVENRVRQDYLLKDALGIGLACARRAYGLICGATGP